MRQIIIGGISETWGEESIVGGETTVVGGCGLEDLAVAVVDGRFFM